MTETEAGAQAALRVIVVALEALRSRLEEVHAHLAPPGETEMLVGAEGMNVSAELRAVIECVLADRLDPAIRDLAAEGSAVGPLVTQLLADADPQGGWGLTPSFVADPLDSALAFGALASQAAVGNDVLIPAFSALVAGQRAGWWTATHSEERRPDRASLDGLAVDLRRG